MRKDIQKMILKGDFENAYSRLADENYDFSFDNMAVDFPQVNLFVMYTFLSYMLAIHELAVIHHTICEFLYFTTKQCIHGDDQLIKYHLEKALELSPDNTRIKKWIVSVYADNPDCPFTETEFDTIVRSTSQSGSIK